MRNAAANLLGQLCRSLGPEILQNAKNVVVQLIKDNLERQSDGVEMQANMGSTGDIFHDTAGWKYLETSMKALQCMAECSNTDEFQAFFDQGLLDLVKQSLSHTNRFVREAGFYTINAFINHGAIGQGNSDYALQFAKLIKAGLSDNWSQVRLSASVACRSFFSSQPDDTTRERYFSVLLPPLCLNRYYMAEGVRIYCQETWKTLVGSQGRSLVEQNIKEIVQFYIECTEADNHAVREAACHCIAELAVKIGEEFLHDHVQLLLQTLLKCFEDDSWPVRDSACVASGNFVKVFPAESKDKMDKLFTLFVANLKDPISSVRQGGAMALSNAVISYPELMEKAVDLIKEGLRDLKNQQKESERYTDLSRDAAQFGVVKRLRDNDISLHENQPMYSCGSLAPKMGRGGGCSDAKFRKPSEPWELADGSVHLFAELTAISGIQYPLHPILMNIITACHQRHYTMHLSFLETVMKRLPGIAQNLGKRNFKPYLEDLLEIVLYGCECENELAKAASQNVISFLSDYLGPNILRGRVEKIHPRYLDLIDASLAGEAMFVDDPIASSRSSLGSMPIPMAPGRGRPEMPSLGGTPT